MNLTEWASVLNLIVVTITLGILCRYAFDTYKMQKSMTRQVELQTKPLLAIELVDKNDLGKLEMQVTNIGNGTALNIEFEPMSLGSEFTELEFIVPTIRSLKVGESRSAIIAPVVSGKESDFLWTAHLQKKYANRVINLNMKYNDIEFKDIYQTFELGLGDLKIKMTRTK